MTGGKLQRQIPAILGNNSYCGCLFGVDCYSDRNGNTISGVCYYGSLDFINHQHDFHMLLVFRVILSGRQQPGFLKLN